MGVVQNGVRGLEAVTEIVLKTGFISKVYDQSSSTS